MIIDIGKGIVATRLIAPLPLTGLRTRRGLWREWLPVVCGLAAILGHVYPIWYGFRGGKGVATLVGVVFGVEPILLGVVLLVWLVTVVLFGFVGLASIVAALLDCGRRGGNGHAALCTTTLLRSSRGAARRIHPSIESRTHASRYRAACASPVAARPSACELMTV